MDFVIGLIVGLFFGGWIGLAIASLITISRDKDIEDIKAELEAEEHENDPDGSKAVMEEAIVTLKEKAYLFDDTWKEDMDWDAQQYEAEKEANSGT